MWVIYTHLYNIKLYKNGIIKKKLLPISGIEKKLNFQENEGGSQIFYLEFTTKNHSRKTGGEVGGFSTLSGQVPDSNGKSILMASLTRLLNMHVSTVLI